MTIDIITLLTIIVISYLVFFALKGYGKVLWASLKFVVRAPFDLSRAKKEHKLARLENKYYKKARKAALEVAIDKYIDSPEVREELDFEAAEIRKTRKELSKYNKEG